MICDNVKFSTSSSSKVNKIIIQNHLEVYYRGFIFVQGLKGQNESLDYFFKKYPNYEDNINKLHGAFTIIIKDNILNQITCFADNSGFMKLYYYKKTVSDSFLELCSYIATSTNTLDYNGIAEFIRLGFNINHTFIEGLSILNKRNYIKFKNNEIIILPKNLCKITSKGTDFYRFFKDLAYTLKDNKVICDLTGGTDSRLMVAMLNYYGVNFDVSISGRKDFIDYRKCMEISNKMNIEPVIFESNNDFNLNICNEILVGNDAQYPILESYRNYYYNKNIKADGYNIRITGANGELFKDESWSLPYFIFKNKMILQNWDRKCNDFHRDNKGLTKQILRNINIVEKEIKDIKNNLKLKYATQSSDNYLYEVDMFYKASNYNIIASRLGLIQYSPLLEYDIARTGFNLNRSQRTATRFHKKIITKVCPQISKITTVKGYTCHDSFLYILRDYFIDIKSFVKRVLDLFLKKNTTSVDGATGDDIYKLAKQNCSEIDTLLKKYSIINNDVNLSEYNDIVFERLFTIGLFIKNLELHNDSQK